ncbi:hypothetical protein ACOMHN_012039 [Nucella lapillus]
MLSRRFASDPFGSDPFFEGHEKHMRDMERFFRDPFAAFRQRMGVQDSSDNRRDDRARRRGGDEPRQDLAPRGFFDFGGFDMFRNMEGFMEDLHKNVEKTGSDPNGHMMSHSSFASYSKMNRSEPKVFQASTSSWRAPGDVRETRKTLRDSETGQEKMAIGRYIGDKGHVIQRQRNHGSSVEENQNFINIEEDEAGEFDREWKEQTRQRGRERGGRQIDRGHRDARREKCPRALRL